MASTISRSVIQVGKWASAALLAVGFGLASPLVADDSSMQADAAAFAHGAKLWAETCNRCHRMRDPKEFRDDQWRVIVTHMQIRTGLTKKEAEEILLFLQTSN